MRTYNLLLLTMTEENIDTVKMINYVMSQSNSNVIIKTFMHKLDAIKPIQLIQQIRNIYINRLSKTSVDKFLSNGFLYDHVVYYDEFLDEINELLYKDRTKYTMLAVYEMFRMTVNKHIKPCEYNADDDDDNEHWWWIHDTMRSALEDGYLNKFYEHDFKIGYNDIIWILNQDQS